MPPSPFDIVFAVYPAVTQLDFTGPYQVLSRVPGARLTLASGSGEPLRSDDGLCFDGLVRLDSIPRCDMLCVPGGPGATAAGLDREFIAELRRLAADARFVTSVCTGSLVLGAAGLLRGRRATCHWAWLDLLPLFGAEPIAERVVRDGNLITGGGVTAGIDFALTVAAELAGDIVAQSIQLGLEYAPAPPFSAGRPDSAPPEVMALVRQRIDAMRERRRGEAEQAAAALG